jgi:hypothetical protein
MISVVCAEDAKVWGKKLNESVDSRYQSDNCLQFYYI